MQVVGQHGGGLPPLMATGARVSNAYPTCPPPGDSLLKGSLIPGISGVPHGTPGIGSGRRGMGMRSISLLAG